MNPDIDIIEPKETDTILLGKPKEEVKEHPFEGVNGSIEGLHWKDGKATKGEVPYRELILKCNCHSLDHAISFSFWEELEEDGLCDFYVSVHLITYKNFFKRCWAAIKYVFGYKCRYGDWDSWSLANKDVYRLKELLEQYEKCTKYKF